MATSQPGNTPTQGTDASTSTLTNPIQPARKKGTSTRTVTLRLTGEAERFLNEICAQANLTEVDVFAKALWLAHETLKPNRVALLKPTVTGALLADLDSTVESVVMIDR